MNKEKNHVICLYEHSGMSAKSWAEAGYYVFCYDILHTEPRTVRVGNGYVTFMPWDATDHYANEQLIERHIGRTAIVLAFPPCTDLAVSGAEHFESKRAINPNFQREAMSLVYKAYNIAIELQAPYVIENPVSVISSLWRKPDYIFHPWEYGGYLPEDDVHPVWPEYIKPRDAYPKKTCYWTGHGFVMPEKRPVPVASGYSDQHKKLGGKSAKTKSIRSCSPRGIAQAIFESNKG